MKMQLHNIGEIDGKEIGAYSVRLFVALYVNRPYTAEEGPADFHVSLVSQVCYA